MIHRQRRGAHGTSAVVAHAGGAPPLPPLRGAQRARLGALTADRRLVHFDEKTILGHAANIGTGVPWNKRSAHWGGPVAAGVAAAATAAIDATM